MKIKNLHIYFFYLFLFSIPFQTRKVFLTEYSFYSGAFTEYATLFIYLSDAFLILALCFWLISSKNLNKQVDFNKLRSAISKNQIWTYLLLFILVLFVNVVFKRDYFEISMFQFLKFIEMILLFLYLSYNLKKPKILINSLYIIVISGFVEATIAIQQFVNQGSIFNNSPILRKVSGESLIGLNISGVANFVFDGQRIMRSYGTFPHPNVLAGFLILSLSMTVYLYLESKRDKMSSKCCLSDNDDTYTSNCQGIVCSLGWILLILVQCSALLFSFSRSAWFSFLISIFIMGIVCFFQRKIVSCETIRMNCFSKYMEKSGEIREVLKSNNIFKNSTKYILKVFSTYISRLKKALRLSIDPVIAVDQIVSRETIDNESFLSKFKKYLFHYKELLIALVLFMCIVVSYFPLINSRLSEDIQQTSNLPNNYALSDRNFYNNVSRETISDDYLLGSGLGTSIFQIDVFIRDNDINEKLEPWQYQPTHNLYLLIASEVGLIGLFIMLLVIFYIINRYHSVVILKLVNSEIVSRETILTRCSTFCYFLLIILFSYLLIGLFDHYFWTLQQGRVMFWLILGFLFVSLNNE